MFQCHGLMHFMYFQIIDDFVPDIGTKSIPLNDSIYYDCRKAMVNTTRASPRFCPE